MVFEVVRAACEGVAALSCDPRTTALDGAGDAFYIPSIHTLYGLNLNLSLNRSP